MRDAARAGAAATDDSETAPIGATARRERRQRVREVRDCAAARRPPRTRARSAVHATSQSSAGREPVACARPCRRPRCAPPAPSATARSGCASAPQPGARARPATPARPAPARASGAPPACASTAAGLGRRPAPRATRSPRRRAGRGAASRRQRLRIVGGSRPGWCATRIRYVPGGGSSSVFSSAFAAAAFIALRRDDDARPWRPARWLVRPRTSRVQRADALDRDRVDADRTSPSSSTSNRLDQRRSGCWPAAT